MKTLDLDLRKAKLSLSENKALLNDGIVRAKRSGIVRNIKDLSNPIQDGSAFLEVATSQGTYIKGNIFKGPFHLPRMLAIPFQLIAGQVEKRLMPKSKVLIQFLLQIVTIMVQVIQM